MLGKYSVDEAYISLDGGGDAKPLCRVMGADNLWKTIISFRDDPIKSRQQYKYAIRCKGHDFKLPLFGRIRLFSKDPSYCEERGERTVRSEVQFDVFHYPDNRNYMYETVPQSVIFYVQWILPSIFPSTILEFCTQIECLDFRSLEMRDAEFIIDWIVKQGSSNSVTDSQCLYLCTVLGHVQANCWYSSLSFPSSNRSKTACDRLLQSFFSCLGFDFISALNLKILKKIALLLVENSSTPGWLTLAAYFYPYFGIKFILDKQYAKSLNYIYAFEEYENAVKVLFSNVNDVKSGDDQLAHKKMLALVLKSAPTLSAALCLSKRADVFALFPCEDEMVDFFVKFCQDKLQDTSTHKETGAKLTDFFQIPKIFRGKMHKSLYPILLEYAKSDENLKDEHVRIFLDSIISESILSVDQVLALLMELSKSKSVPRQNLLLDILDSKRFEMVWHEIQLARKVAICTSWVMTTVVRASCNPGLDKTRTVYEAIDAIMQCSLNTTNTTLAKEVSAHVVTRILENEDAIAVLQAFPTIEECGAVVQDCYKSHVRKMLEQAPKVVKKSSKFLKECSSSRYVNKLRNLFCFIKQTHFHKKETFKVHAT